MTAQFGLEFLPRGGVGAAALMFGGLSEATAIVQVRLSDGRGSASNVRIGIQTARVAVIIGQEHTAERLRTVSRSRDTSVLLWMWCSAR